MKSNCKTRTSRFLMLAGRILMLAGLLLSGCSGPSQITVTGIGTVQSEVPFLPEGRAPEAPDTGTPADGSADTGVQANETADADASSKGSAETVKWRRDRQMPVRMQKTLCLPGWSRSLYMSAVP